MPHDLCLQQLITNVSYCSVNRIGRQVVLVKHVEGAVRDMLYRRDVVGCRVQLGAIVSASKCELAYHVQVSRHVDLDELGRCWDSVFVGDGEGDEIHPSVVDESLGQIKWRHCS